MTKKKNTRPNDRDQKRAFVAQVDDGIIHITGEILAGEGAKIENNFVKIEYDELIQGQNFKLRIEMTATGGLFFVRGVLRTGIDSKCKDCLANFNKMVNSLYADPVVFYGKIVLNGNTPEYNYSLYYPFSTKIETLVDTWDHFIPVVYNSARKDISTFLTALKQLSEYTKTNGCSIEIPSEATFH